jgi:hypothetical protein
LTSPGNVLTEVSRQITGRPALQFSQVPQNTDRQVITGRMAQGRERRAQQHLVRPRLPDVDVLDHERLVRLVQHGSSHGASPWGDGEGIEANVAQARRG